MGIDLRSFISRAPWMAEDIRSEAILCELEDLTDDATRKRLWRLVFSSLAIKGPTFNIDQVVCHRPVSRSRKPYRIMTSGECRRFERDLCIQVCSLVGVSQRTLAKVHKLPPSRIDAICKANLHEKLDKLLGRIKRQTEKDDHEEVGISRNGR